MKAFDVDIESATEAIEVIRSDQSSPSLGFMESLTMPDVQEVVLSADVRCSDCQKRILDMISRFDETESVVVNLSEKKVAITCKYIKGSKKQIIARQKITFGKVALIKRIFGSSRT